MIFYSLCGNFRQTHLRQTSFHPCTSLIAHSQVELWPRIPQFPWLLPQLSCLHHVSLFGCLQSHDTLACCCITTTDTLEIFEHCFKCLSLACVCDRLQIVEKILLVLILHFFYPYSSKTQISCIYTNRKSIYAIKFGEQVLKHQRKKAPRK